MVLRDIDKESFYLKIDGKWVFIDQEVLQAHPGGSAITTYRNKEASTVFHTFHAGSKKAYNWLQDLKKSSPTQEPAISNELEDLLPGYEDVNMGKFDISQEKSDEITKNFDKLRMKLRSDGFMEGSYVFYIRKVLESIGIICLAVFLQSKEWYVPSAILMGLAWQQLGWLIHEFTHNQLFKDHWHNDLASYFVGNFLQGFSSGGWKEQHNIHHAATNVVGRDGDLDLMPFYATVVQDLKSCDNWLLKILPYQHIYWSVMLPLLRLSWLSQSIQFVLAMPTHFYIYYRERAIYEQTSLLAHWILSLLQLYMLPDFQTRVMFFLVSHLTGGFLLAHVVTYNHYSVEKFPYNSNIMSNYACLQLYTTRNMRPGTFIDWLWGGLNYQIEHHLFPTMPRHNLSKVMPIVQEFCKENDLPYMVDDYFTGWRLAQTQEVDSGAWTDNQFAQASEFCDHCERMHDDSGNQSNENINGSAAIVPNERLVAAQELVNVSDLTVADLRLDVVSPSSRSAEDVGERNGEPSTSESARNHIKREIEHIDTDFERQCANVSPNTDLKESLNVSRHQSSSARTLEITELGAPANFVNSQVLIRKILPKKDYYKILSREVSKNPLGWQADKKTVKDRFEFLFCNEVLADVFFYVGPEEEKQKIPAHTFVLSIGSAVFDAMFNSHDTKQNEAFEVFVSDVEPSIFVSLLRFFYTDEVKVGPESVMSTLYIAKKYGVPAMENTCLLFLKENLEADNAFLLLGQARLFDEKDLEEMCWGVIDRETFDAIQNDGFLDIDHSTLCDFLRRDTIRIKEAVLFLSVIRWADAECIRKSIQKTSENHKSVLGDAIMLIRFPLMSVEEFANVAAQPGLLDDHDIVTQFLHYHKNPKTPSKFSDRPRFATSGKELRIQRFAKSEARWGYSGAADKIKFSVDKPIFVLGYGVYGSIQGFHEYSVSLELVHTEKGHSIAKNETSYTSDGSSKIYSVYFREPVHIEANTFYTASVVLKGPDTFYGTKGQRKVVYQMNGEMEDITFLFSYNGTNNGTSVDDGQIPEILFSTQMT